MSAIRRIRTHLDTATERGCVRKHQPQHVEKLGHQAYYSRQQSCEAAAAGPAAGHSHAPGALRGCVRHGPGRTWTLQRSAAVCESTSRSTLKSSGIRRITAGSSLVKLLRLVPLRDTAALRGHCADASATAPGRTWTLQRSTAFIRQWARLIECPAG